jgi:predicted DNA-binding antitoxin AbrB/MazE fold protein
MQTVIATFEDGVLKPAQPLSLPEHAQVCVTIEVLAADEQTKQNQETLAALQSLWQSSNVYSTERLTRDQLHERR